MNYEKYILYSCIMFINNFFIYKIGRNKGIKHERSKQENKSEIKECPLLGSLHPSQVIDTTFIFDEDIHYYKYKDNNLEINFQLCHDPIHTTEENIMKCLTNWKECEFYKRNKK